MDQDKEPVKRLSQDICLEADSALYAIGARMRAVDPKVRRRQAIEAVCLTADAEACVALARQRRAEREAETEGSE